MQLVLKSVLRVVKLLPAILACGAINDAARAATFSNSLDADAFVRAAAATLNYGAAGALSVSGSTATNSAGVTNGASDSFIRFNTGALVTNYNSLFGPNNWIVNGATLRVTEVSTPNNAIFSKGLGSFEIRWIANDSWTEGAGNPGTPTTNGIAYVNEPSLLNTNTDVSLGTFTNTGTDAALSFQLALPVAFVNDVRAGGEVGLYLTAIDPEIGFTFDSRTFMTNSLRPFMQFSAVPVPGIVSIRISGANVIIDASNGVAGGTYRVLTSMNAALPLNQWAPMDTNMPATNGNFTITLTNAWNANAPWEQFFILQTQ